jgi:uncharacterized protein YxeA
VQQEVVEYLVMMLIVLILGNLYKHHIMLGRGVPIVHIHKQWYKENHPGGILTETLQCARCLLATPTGLWLQH